MSEDIVVSSVEEYRSACITLSRENKIYWRGQTSDYPKILPSLFRPGAIVDESFENLIVRLYASCYGIGDWQELQKTRVDDFEDHQPAGVFPNLFPGGLVLDYRQFPTKGLLDNRGSIMTSTSISKF